MAVSRCPHCGTLLLPDEACVTCIGGLTPAGPAAQTTPAAAVAPPPAPVRRPWPLWAAVVVLIASNVVTLAWLAWRETTGRSVGPHAIAVADAVKPPETVPPTQTAVPEVGNPAEQAPAPRIEKAPDAPEPPPPMQPAVVPAAPVVVAAPNPVPAPVPVPQVVVPIPPPPDMRDLANLDGLRGRVDWNAAGEVVALRLGDSDMGDNDLILLRDFAGLRVLNLDKTQVTDAGLGLLTRLTRLRELHLGGTKVTDAGVRELQRTLPDVKITR